MANVIAKILIEGDKHFCSKNYGGHVDYANETITYCNKVRDIIVNEGVTHYINGGDFSYGRFDSLEYRGKVDNAIDELRQLVNGNLWFIKGNHDKASYGQTEYEYYLGRRMFKGSENLDFALGTPNGGLHLEMKDYKDFSQFKEVPGAINILVTHGYFVGKAEENPIIPPQVILQEYPAWAGADMLICGHIHTESLEKVKGYGGKDVTIHYLPCLSRPAYIKDFRPATGSVDLITVYDDGAVEFAQIPIEFLPDEESFDLAKIQLQKEKEKSAEHAAIDVADIAKRLEEHTRVMGNPVLAIEACDAPPAVKELAKELLKEAKA